MNAPWNSSPPIRWRAAACTPPALGMKPTSAQGVALVEPYSFQFLTAGDLQVTQVFPSDGASDVASSAVITVIFNRPVVPLGMAEEEANLPNPLIALTPGGRKR